MSITHLKAGDVAPSFSANDQNGNTVSLADFKGKKVALYFYPRDNTPTCTTQACNLRDNYAVLQQHGIVVLGVSPDHERSHTKFITKHDLPFTLLVDTEKELANAYGVFGEKKFMGRITQGIHRTTFLIDEAGNIEQVIKKVKAKIHSQQILEALALV